MQAVKRILHSKSAFALAVTVMAAFALPKLLSCQEVHSASGYPPSQVQALPSLPLVVNADVSWFLHYYTTIGHDDFALGMRRAGQYRDMMERVFRDEGVPVELIYIAQVESAFDVLCTNRSGARGIWQFMPSRADDYHLVRTQWIDDRQDPEKSTVAAAHHLKDLYAEFGDWNLAMSAYLLGPQPVHQAIARTGLTDFWQLSQAAAFSKTARDYVPNVIAAAIIAANPLQYGFEEIKVSHPQTYETVHLIAALDISLAADCARTSASELRGLNPSLLHSRAPGDFYLKVPVGSSDRFKKTLALVPMDKRLIWRVHWMRPAETVTQVAVRNGVNADRVSIVNHLAAGVSPAPGKPLVIPLLPKPVATTSAPAGAKHTG